LADRRCHCGDASRLKKGGCDLASRNQHLGVPRLVTKMLRLDVAVDIPWNARRQSVGISAASESKVSLSIGFPAIKCFSVKRPETPWQ